jgi:hypothetical protein
VIIKIIKIMIMRIIKLKNNSGRFFGFYTSLVLKLKMLVGFVEERIYFDALVVHLIISFVIFINVLVLSFGWKTKVFYERPRNWYFSKYRSIVIRGWKWNETVFFRNETKRKIFEKTRNEMKRNDIQNFNKRNWNEKIIPKNEITKNVEKFFCSRRNILFWKYKIKLKKSK